MAHFWNILSLPLPLIAAVSVVVFTSMLHRSGQMQGHAAELGTGGSGVAWRRVLGTTRFSDPDLYDPVEVSPQQLGEYLTEGVTILRRAFRPSVIAELRQALEVELAGGTDDAHENLDFQTWMDSSNLLDFYTYSPLGSVAAQIFGSPGTETASEAPTVFLWGDLRRRRTPAKPQPAPTWHIDGPGGIGQECSAPAPSRFTRRAGLRALVLLDDDVPGTVIINQTAFASAMEALRPGSAGSYLRGDLRFPSCANIMGQGHPVIDKPMLDALAEPALEAAFRPFKPQSLQRGDVILHSSCLFHRSPPFRGTRPAIFVGPTFAPGSRTITCPLRSDSALPKEYMRVCSHNLPLGARISEGSPCFPAVYPVSARPRAGEVLHARKTCPP